MLLGTHKIIGVLSTSLQACNQAMVPRVCRHGPPYVLDTAASSPMYEQKNGINPW